jgi:hypothetical protein
VRPFQRLFNVFPFRQGRSAFIKSENYVCPQGFLYFYRFPWPDKKLIAVQGRSKMHALADYFKEFRLFAPFYRFRIFARKKLKNFPNVKIPAESQRKNLESARIGHQRFRPVHKLIKSARRFNNAFVGLQVQMKSVANQNLRASFQGLFAI